MNELPGARPVHSEKHGLRVARASICSSCQCGCSAHHPELTEAKGEVRRLCGAFVCLLFVKTHMRAYFDLAYICMCFWVDENAVQLDPE